MPLLRTIRVPLQQGGRTPQCNMQLHAVPPGPASSPGALDRVRQGRTRQTHPGTRHHSAANTDSYSYTDTYSRPHALTVPHRSCPLPWPSHVPSAFQFGLSHWPTSFENSTEKRICACTRHGSTVSKTDRRHSQRTFATRARVGSLQHRRYNQPTVMKRSVVQKKNNLDLVPIRRMLASRLAREAVKAGKIGARFGSTSGPTAGKHHIALRVAFRYAQGPQGSCCCQE